MSDKCSTCGKTDDSMEYIGQEGDKPRPYCSDCAEMAEHEIEIIMCFDSGSWDTEMISIPKELWEKHNTDDVAEWITENDPKECVQIGVYNWNDDGGLDTEETTTKTIRVDKKNQNLYIVGEIVKHPIKKVPNYDYEVISINWSDYISSYLVELELVD